MSIQISVTAAPAPSILALDAQIRDLSALHDQHKQALLAADEDSPEWQQAHEAMNLVFYEREAAQDLLLNSETKTPEDAAVLSLHLALELDILAGQPMGEVESQRELRRWQVAAISITRLLARHTGLDIDQLSAGAINQRTSEPLTFWSRGFDEPPS